MCIGTAQLYKKYEKKPTKTQLEGKSRQVIHGALISLRTTTAIFSHGGKRLTVTPLAGGE